MTTGQSFLVQRSGLSQTRVDTFDASAPPARGQIRLRIEHFAFTANNITYAVFGEHWRGQLVYSCSVGGTHPEALGSGGGLPGPKPQFFVAPTQMQKRSAPPPQGLGRAAMLAQIDDAWDEFVARATAGETPWLPTPCARPTSKPCRAAPTPVVG